MVSLRRNIVADTLRGLIADDVLGESAKVAFFLILSLFPLLMVVLALTGIIGGYAAFEVIMQTLHETMPAEAATYVQQFVEEVALEERPEVLSIGIILTMWSASMALFKLAEGLNVMYGLSERKSWVMRRLLAIGVLLAGSLVLVTGIAILLIGPEVLDFVGLEPVWALLRLPLSFGLLVLVLAVMFRLLPNRRGEVRWSGIFAGAAVGALLMLIATFGIRIYVEHFAQLDATYGALGGVIILILWLLVMTVAILAGAKMAAVIEMSLGAGVSPSIGGRD